MKLNIKINQYLFRKNFQEFTLIPTIHLALNKKGRMEIFPILQIKVMLFIVSVTINIFKNK